MEGEPSRASRRNVAGLRALVVLAFGWIGATNALAADAPWRWTVSAIPGQMLQSLNQDDGALRALQGQYAFADVE
jgi:hypothetical protein